MNKGLFLFFFCFKVDDGVVEVDTSKEHACVSYTITHIYIVEIIKLNRIPEEHVLQLAIALAENSSGDLLVGIS